MVLGTHFPKGVFEAYATVAKTQQRFGCSLRVLCYRDRTLKELSLLVPGPDPPVGIRVVRPSDTAVCRTSTCYSVSQVEQPSSPLPPRCLARFSTRSDGHHFGAGVHPGRIDLQQCAKAVRNLSVAFVGGVLISKRDRVGPVAESVHQLGQRGARNRGPLRARAAQVVEVQTSYASRASGCRPCCTLSEETPPDATLGR